MQQSPTDIVVVVVVVTSPAGAVAKYCDEYVCLSVCPRGYLRNDTRDLCQFLYLLPMYELGPPAAC